ncbi:hypothetical protein ACWEVD_21020 [Nocardia thailandica]
MDHAEHGESIGALLAGIAATLREVGDKLDLVAARVQESPVFFPAPDGAPDGQRIDRLESWAFRAAQDLSRLSERLDKLDGPDPGEPDPPAGPGRRRAPDTDPAAAGRPPLERRQSPARSARHAGDDRSTELGRAVADGASEVSAALNGVARAARNGSPVTTQITFRDKGIHQTITLPPPALTAENLGLLAPVDDESRPGPADSVPPRNGRPPRLPAPGATTPPADDDRATPARPLNGRAPRLSTPEATVSRLAEAAGLRPDGTRLDSPRAPEAPAADQLRAPHPRRATPTDPATDQPVRGVGANLGTTTGDAAEAAGAAAPGRSAGSDPSASTGIAAAHGAAGSPAGPGSGAPGSTAGPSAPHTTTTTGAADLSGGPTGPGAPTRTGALPEVAPVPAAFTRPDRDAAPGTTVGTGGAAQAPSGAPAATGPDTGRSSGRSRPATGFAATADAGSAPADAGFTTTDARGATTDAGFATADAGSATADAGFTTTDGRAATADAGFATTDARGATTDAGAATTDARGATTDAAFTTTDARGATADAGFTTTDARGATTARFAAPGDGVGDSGLQASGRETGLGPSAAAGSAGADRAADAGAGARDGGADRASRPSPAGLSSAGLSSAGLSPLGADTTPDHSAFAAPHRSAAPADGTYAPRAAASPIPPDPSKTPGSAVASGGSRSGADPAGPGRAASAPGAPGDPASGPASVVPNPAPGPGGDATSSRTGSPAGRATTFDRAAIAGPVSEGPSAPAPFGARTTGVPATPAGGAPGLADDRAGAASPTADREPSPARHRDSGEQADRSAVARHGVATGDVPREAAAPESAGGGVFGPPSAFVPPSAPEADTAAHPVVSPHGVDPTEITTPVRQGRLSGPLTGRDDVTSPYPSAPAPGTDRPGALDLARAAMRSPSGDAPAGAPDRAQATGSDRTDDASAPLTGGAHPSIDAGAHTGHGYAAAPPLGQGPAAGSPEPLPHGPTAAPSDPRATERRHGGADPAATPPAALDHGNAIGSPAARGHVGAPAGALTGHGLLDTSSGSPTDGGLPSSPAGSSSDRGLSGTPAGSSTGPGLTAHTAGSALDQENPSIPAGSSSDHRLSGAPAGSSTGSGRTANTAGSPAGYGLTNPSAGDPHGWAAPGRLTGPDPTGSPAGSAADTELPGARGGSITGRGQDEATAGPADGSGADTAPTGHRYSDAAGPRTDRAPADAVGPATHQGFPHTSAGSATTRGGADTAGGSAADPGQAGGAAQAPTGRRYADTTAAAPAPHGHTDRADDPSTGGGHGVSWSASPVTDRTGTSTWGAPGSEDATAHTADFLPAPVNGTGIGHGAPTTPLPLAQALGPVGDGAPSGDGPARDRVGSQEDSGVAGAAARPGLTTGTPADRSVVGPWMAGVAEPEREDGDSQWRAGWALLGDEPPTERQAREGDAFGAMISTAEHGREGLGRRAAPEPGLLADRDSRQGTPADQARDSSAMFTEFTPREQLPGETRSDPEPPTKTDAAGITVTGTFRAFDAESKHVDKLQAMLEELKRNSGMPPLPRSKDRD